MDRTTPPEGEGDRRRELKSYRPPRALSGGVCEKIMYIPVFFQNNPVSRRRKEGRVCFPWGEHSLPSGYIDAREYSSLPTALVVVLVIVVIVTDAANIGTSAPFFW